MSQKSSSSIGETSLKKEEKERNFKKKDITKNKNFHNMPQQNVL